MSSTSELELYEEQIVAHDITDENLEAAANSQSGPAGIYTLGSCTGFYSCPPQLS